MRSSDAYLGDRTAFDAALWVRVGGEHRLIGIETKYHEHAPAGPVRRQRMGVEHRREPNPRYVEVTERARLFDEGTRSTTSGTFAHRTLDDLVHSAADLLPHADDLATRYLAVP